MNTGQGHNHQPKLGLQGPVLAWQDPWATDVSDQYMRTGTGMIYPSQDPTPSREDYIAILKELGAAFYVHHLFPNLAGQTELLEDMVQYDIALCLGNEYGNINGPWQEGTNRYDIPDAVIVEAARSGKLIGLLYDEPEHLQINAGQYRKDGWYPHWGATEGLSLKDAADKVTGAIAQQVERVQTLLQTNGLDMQSAPFISEQVFPVLFHTQARAGMTICAKIMKESFQSLQLSTALGAAKQYNRRMWICADLWGPDIGQWFTRTSGFPGHSPEEYESALQMGYFMAPTHLFTENVDVLLDYSRRKFRLTEYGEIWQQFVKQFVPQHPLSWTHNEVDADIAIICSDDSNYGQNARLFGNREMVVPESTKSVFHIWHLLSHGTIPAHGGCMHIPGYDFPRHELKKRMPTESYPLQTGRNPLPQSAMHPLFYPVNNVIVYDENIREQQLGNPKLLLVTGSRISPETLLAIRKRAEKGATVVVAQWLVPTQWREDRRFGDGYWMVTDSFQDERVKEMVTPHLGNKDCWMQRFGDVEVRMYKKDSKGFTLDFDIHHINNLSSSGG